MFFDYKTRQAQIWIRHKRNAKLMRAAGVTESGLKSLLALDNHELYSDRHFYEGLDKYLDPCHNPAAPGDAAPEFCLDVMDSIEDPDLHRAMMTLKPRDRDLVILHDVEGLSLESIAALWSTSYASIQRAHYRAIEKIKNFQHKCV